jgi:Ni/Co efflux regulator RcnB
MKRFLAGALALSLLGGTAALAQPGHDDHRGGPQNHGGPGPQDHGGGGRHWNHGDHLDNRYGANQPVTNWRSHHLSAPRHGYHWVRSGDDYVEAALVGGLIGSVVAASR